MNCDEFLKQVGEVGFVPKSRTSLRDELSEHATSCPGCEKRFKAEQALTSGLEMLAIDDRNTGAPSSLRNELLVAFENHACVVPAAVISFPHRTNWARWTLAAAATLILGLLLFSVSLFLEPPALESAGGVAPNVFLKMRDGIRKSVSTSTSSDRDSAPVMAAANRSKTPSQATRTAPQRYGTTRMSSSEVASTEVVKSEFVPLTYLNDATAMESGMVVRVEIAREQLATLGLPFDVGRADEIIKADIVLGDDGVARAIRLVQ